MPTDLVLASASPRRLELLTRIGVPVEVAPADVDEAVLPGESPEACVLRLSRDKALAVAGRLGGGRWVLAADTVVALEDCILGKPDSPAEAREMLTRLLGRTHRVVTGFALVGPAGEAASRAVTTEVDLRAAGPGEIDGYVASEEWRGKAGGYAAQGIAAAFITAVRGSFSNVVGLPLAEVIVELTRAGAALPDYARGAPA
jgi:septum formation protein